MLLLLIIWKRQDTHIFKDHAEILLFQAYHRNVPQRGIWAIMAFHRREAWSFPADEPYKASLGDGLVAKRSDFIRHGEQSEAEGGVVLRLGVAERDSGRLRARRGLLMYVATFPRSYTSRQFRRPSQ